MRKSYTERNLRIWKKETRKSSSREDANRTIEFELNLHIVPRNRANLSLSPPTQ